MTINRITIAADNYNLERGDTNFFEDTIDGITAVAGSAVVGAVNSAGWAFNAINNALVSEDRETQFESQDTGEALASAGFAGAASFYEEHRQGVDVAGMIAGSLIPGGVGVAAVRNASNSSKVMGALGLNRSKLEEFREAAKQAAVAEKQIFQPLHAATVKAAASGVGVNTVEALGFELAALSTTIASPVYDEMTAKDMAVNIATFGVAGGGAIGGAFSFAKTYYNVVRAAEAKAAASVIAQTGSEFSNAVDNALRMKASGVGDVRIAEQLLKATGDDSAIAPRIVSLFKQQDLDTAANTFGFTHKISRIADIEMKVEKQKMITGVRPLPGGATEDIVETVEVQRIAKPMQYLDLETNKMYDSTKKLQGNIGDITPRAAKEPTILPAQDRLLIRNSNDAVVKDIKARALQEVDTVAEAQVAYLSRALKGVTGDISKKDIPALEYYVQNFDELSGKVSVDGLRLADRDAARRLLLESKQETEQLLADKGIPSEIRRRMLNLPDNGISAWKVPMQVDAWKKEAFTPRYAAISYDLEGISTNMLGKSEKLAAEVAGPFSLYGRQAIAHAEARALENSVQREIVAATSWNMLGIGEVAASFMPERAVRQILHTVSKVSQAAGFASFANGAYGSAMSWAQNTGRMAQNAALKTFALASERLQPKLHEVLKDSLLADEAILAMNKWRLTQTHYVMLPGKNELVRLDVARALKNPRNQIDETLDINRNPDVIKLSPQVADLFREHFDINLNRYRKPTSNVNTAHGVWDVKANEKDADFLPVYFPPLDLQRYKHFMLVRQNPEVFGADASVSVIVAPDAAKLAEKVERAKQSIIADGDDIGRYQFLTKDDVKSHHEVLGSYEYNRGFNTSRVDNTLRRAGVLGEERPILASHTPEAAKDFAEDLMKFHQRSSERTTRDIVESQYAEAFTQLRAMGDELLEIEKSAKGNVTEAALRSVKNPYLDVIKTALNFSTFDEYKAYSQLNRWTEAVGSKAINAIRKVATEAFAAVEKKGVAHLNEKELDELSGKLNEVAHRVGMPGPGVAMQHAYADMIAERPMLAKAISRGNGIVATYALGLDPLHHINSAIGAVMQSAEVSSVFSAIKRKDASVAGKLAEINLPPEIGTGTFFAPAKLTGSAIARFFKGGSIVTDDGAGGFHRINVDGKRLLQEYEAEGFTMTELQQFRRVIDNLSFSGTEGYADLNAKVLDSIQAVGEKGKALLGGNFVERFTRFIAVDAMRQLTDEALMQGVLKSKAEAMTYWNTAVNRIQGNYTAAQRPVMFQGNIGQAIGLFMTYQVNLMQQLFRYVGNRDKVGSAMLLGTQTSLYGMQGVPGWNFINSYLIGEAEGNIAHTDAYVAVNSLLGHTTANWALYGLASNILSPLSPELATNIYTRGDINPRQLTIVPTDITNTVLYGAISKFTGNLLETAKNIQSGAPLDQAFYQALQMNGINRPLAGLGAILAGGTYTADGKLIATANEQQEVLNLGNLVRIIGGKPLADAQAADALFRNRAWNAADAEARDRIAEAVRLESADGSVDPEKWEDFVHQYVRTGGSPENFRRFAIEKLKDQEYGIVERSAEKFRTPMLQNFLKVIGGDEPEFEFERREF